MERKRAGMKKKENGKKDIRRKKRLREGGKKRIDKLPSIYICDIK